MTSLTALKSLRALKLPRRLARWIAPLWTPLLARLEALPERDRWALLACTLALAVASEMLVLEPMNQKRQAVAAASANEAQARLGLASSLSTEQGLQLQALQDRAAQLSAELVRHGVAQVQGEALAGLLERALRTHAVRTVSLRSLSSEALTSDPPEVALPGALETTDTAVSAPQRSLYRHRYELVLAGDAAGLSASARALESGLAPLQIERIRLLPEQPPELRLVVTFGLTGTESSWLKL